MAHRRKFNRKDKWEATWEELFTLFPLSTVEGRLISLEDFSETKGIGYLATENAMSNIQVTAGQIKEKKLPANTQGFTHVMWLED